MAKQMQMMTFMMVFFGFIFYSFPAGFLLYFIASAAISMVESKIIKKKLAKEGLGPLAPPDAQGNPSGPGPKKSGPAQAMYTSKKIRGEKKKKKKKKPF